MKREDEVLDDLDATLDELIVNAHTLRQIQNNARFQTETDALKKTQESLLARVLYRQKLLQEKKKQALSERAAKKHHLIEAKLDHFTKLSTDLIPTNHPRKRPMRLSRRRKRALVRR